MENKVISFPHMGDYCYFIKPFLENLTNLEVKIAPPITKKTIELGAKYSPDSICLPFKYNLGNINWSYLLSSKSSYNIPNNFSFFFIVLKKWI